MKNWLVLVFFGLYSFIPLLAQDEDLAESEYPIVFVETDDPKMNAAIKEARNTLDTFFTEFNKTKKRGSGFSLKYAFDTDDEGSEHIWLSDIVDSDGDLSGTVGNDPMYVEGLEYGDPIKIDLARVSDWMFYKDDKLIGGYTIRVSIELMPKEQQLLIKKELGID